ARAPASASADVRGLLADVRYRRGGTEEKLSLIDDAREDYRLACDLGREDACARAAVLAPKAAAPAPKRKKRRFVPNPAGDSGTRIYAN
ncbi:MAG: hypothetical protein KGL74_06640, partial [Elusimicrobia bacterium]|nr:hypothetical protein [Elusimicrobiota bacterium]